MKVMEAVSNAGLTINPEKYWFCSKETKFWGMIFSGDEMRPDLAKIDVLNFITIPTMNDDLISFYVWSSQTWTSYWTLLKRLHH